MRNKGSDLLETARALWDLWLKSLQVDRRQRKFLVAAGVLDLGFIVAMTSGHSIISAICAVLGFAVSYKALKLRQAWDEEQARANQIRPHG